MSLLLFESPLPSRSLVPLCIPQGGQHSADHTFLSLSSPFVSLFSRLSSLLSSLPLLSLCDISRLFWRRAGHGPSGCAAHSHCQREKQRQNEDKGGIREKRTQEYDQKGSGRVRKGLLDGRWTDRQSERERRKGHGADEHSQG